MNKTYVKKELLNTGRLDLGISQAHSMSTQCKISLKGLGMECAEDFKYNCLQL